MVTLKMGRSATAYREIGVLRPDGVVGVVALVRVPVHRGFFGGGVGKQRQEARVAVVGMTGRGVVGQGSGGVAPGVVVRGEKRRRSDCQNSDRPSLLTNEAPANRISIMAENQLRRSSSYYPTPPSPPQCANLKCTCGPGSLFGLSRPTYSTLPE